MKRSTCQVSLMLVVVPMMGLAVPGSAQQPTPQVITIKATFAGIHTSQIIPSEPPVVGVTLNAAGQDATLGKFTFHAKSEIRLGRTGPGPQDFRATRFTDAYGTLSWTNGDTLFLTQGGPIFPTSKPNVVMYQGVFEITGGLGRFLGAGGSGNIISIVDLGTNQVTSEVDGVVVTGFALGSPTTTTGGGQTTPAAGGQQTPTTGGQATTPPAGTGTSGGTGSKP
jgi:hypothetical protein